MRALRDGKSPEGRTYYPAFPYTAYSGMRREDMLDLKAYLDTVEPVAAPNRPHQLRFPFSVRLFLHPWRWLFFDREADAVTIPPRTSASHAGAIWSRRSATAPSATRPATCWARSRPGLHMAGSRYGPGGISVPNITPDAETGIGSWSEVDLAFFLRTGFTPYGDDVQGEMREAIDDGLRHLTQADLEAMAAYLKALPAIRNPVSTSPSPPPAFSSGGDW